MILAVMLPVAALMFVLGIFIKQGKGLWLLAGYNTMSNEEKRNVDSGKLSRYAGNLMFRLSGEWAAAVAALFIEQGIIAGILFGAFIADALITCIWINRKLFASAQPRYAKKAGAAAILVSAAVGIFICALFFAGESEPKVYLHAGELVIDSMYGINIDVADIEDIRLDDRCFEDIVPDARRTNGYGGFGDTLKGNFDSKEQGEIMLFVHAGSLPTIIIDRNKGKTVYISMKDPDDTAELYAYLESKNIY